MYFFSLSEAVPWTGWTESQLKSEESQEQYFFNIPLVSVSNCAVWVLFLCSCYVFMFMFNTLSACVFDLLPVSWPDPVGFGILDTSALNSVLIIGLLTFACLLTTRLPFTFGLLPENFIKTLKLELCCLQVGPSLLRVVTQWVQWQEVVEQWVIFLGTQF